MIFISYLFRRDIRERPNVTGALWLPLVWMFIICSRALSEWLSLFGLHVGGVSLEQGSPVDACFYFTLIAAGAYVLAQRRINLSKVIHDNRWLTIFFVYCFLSIFWSDFPLVAFKRWNKVIGHPIMVLILLTEPDPEEALTVLMKRCAYIIVPVSILFIKYFPQWGRGFSEWTGAGYNTGITLGKNALGYDCLILGFFFAWHWLKTWKIEKGRARRNELLLTGAFLYMIWWLLTGAQSATCLASLLTAVIILFLLGSPSLDRHRIGAYVIIIVVICIVAELAFGVSSYAIELLGRDESLTDRTQIWHDVLQIPINPILGRGFESFWLGDRLKVLWAKHWWHPNEAHNGYLETYLTLGLVGLFLLTCLLVATFRNSRLELLTNFELGRFRLGFLAAVLLYNWTESSFRALHPVWFVFYVIALDYPEPEFKPENQSGWLPEDESSELVSESKAEWESVEEAHC